MSDVVVKNAEIVRIKNPGKLGGAIVEVRPLGERRLFRCIIPGKACIKVPSVGEFWQFEGMFVDNPEFGEQLHVSRCRPVPLPDPAYVASYLAHHPGFRGTYVAGKKVGDLIDEFTGHGLVEILKEGNVYLLSKVLNLELARRLVYAWKTVQSDIDTINFLTDHNFSPRLARKVISICREDTVDRLKKNPYALVCFGNVSKNIWKTVEDCSKALGLSLDYEGRLIGAIEHVLYESLRDGNTAMGKQALLEGAEKLLRSRRRAEKGLKLALKKKALCVYPRRSGELFQLAGVGILEQTLERRIKNLQTGARQMSLFGNDEERLHKIVDKYSKEQALAGGHALNARQKAAIVMALTNRLSVMTGYGGTGKTTVLKTVVDVAKASHRRTYLLALAGKAKERLKLATGHQSFTIHAFINAVKKRADDITIEDDPLVVIDECSMVDTALFNQLLDLFEGKPFSLLTVGDTAQISPVGFGLVWHRLAKISGIPKIHLTEVYRQRSALHDLAMNVRPDADEVDIDKLVDSVPDWSGQIEGVYFVDADARNLREKLTNLKVDVDAKLKEQVKKQFAEDLSGAALEVRMCTAEDNGEIPRSIILTPHMTERMPDSGAKINRSLQKRLTPFENAFQLGKNWFRYGDPVIITDNNYDLRLFNGTTGSLLGVGIRNNEVCGKFRFEGRDTVVWLTIDEMFDVGLQLAYAVSVHKSQGSEYEAVLFSCVTSSEMMEKSLVYTALTRAKGLCLIVGSRDIFKKAISGPSRAETLEVGFFLSEMDMLKLAS